MLTNRRSSEGSGAWPVISRRQEKAGCLPCATPSRASAIAVTAGLMPSSVVFPRRTPSIDCEMRAEDAVQRRIGGERAEEGLGLDQLRHVASHFVDGLEEDAVAGEELAAVGPAHGADHVRLGRERVGQRRRRLLGCFRRRRVDDRDDPVGPLGEELVEPDLLLAPGERARQELAAVGVDGDMAREIAAREDAAAMRKPGMTSQA